MTQPQVQVLPALMHRQARTLPYCVIAIRLGLSTTLIGLGFAGGGGARGGGSFGGPGGACQQSHKAEALAGNGGGGIPGSSPSWSGFATGRHTMLHNKH